MDFTGKAKDIESVDISRIASTIGIGEDELHAFFEVEAAGSPWDKKRRPKMLFEPHKFYKHLGKGPKRDRAVREGLAYPKWGQKPYPKDSYPRLEAAMKIDAKAAIMSCSLGYTQILSEYYADLGYDSPEAMFRAFADDAETHIEATVALMVKWKIDDDLRRLAAKKTKTTPGDCEAIVRVWNGPGYKKNNYHVKFANAHNKWRGIPDTPYKVPETDENVPGIEPETEGQVAEKVEAKLYTDKTTVAVVQEKLQKLNYNVGSYDPVTKTYDGIVGKLTREGIVSFRMDNGLPLTDKIDDEFLLALDKAKPRELAPARTEAEHKEVVATVPEAATNWWNKITGQGLTGLGGLGALGAFITSTFKETTEAIQPIKDFIGDQPAWVWFALMAAVGGFAWWNSRKGEKQIVEAYRTGDRR